MPGELRTMHGVQATPATNEAEVMTVDDLARCLRVSRRRACDLLRLRWLRSCVSGVSFGCRAKPCGCSSRRVGTRWVQAVAVEGRRMAHAQRTPADATAEPGARGEVRRSQHVGLERAETAVHGGGLHRRGELEAEAARHDVSLSSNERAKRLAVIDRKARAVAIREELLICHLEQAHVETLRREDALPEIVLLTTLDDEAAA